MVEHRLSESVLNLSKIVIDTNQRIRIPFGSSHWTMAHEESGGILFKKEGKAKFLIEVS